jgi:hypothetical protein
MEGRMDEQKLSAIESSRKWWINSHIQWPKDSGEMAHLLAFYASHVTVELREKLEWCESGRDNVAMENRELRAECDALRKQIDAVIQQFGDADADGDQELIEVVTDIYNHGNQGWNLAGTHMFERDAALARVEQLEKALGDLWEDCASAGSDIPSQVELVAPSPEYWMAAEKALIAHSHAKEPEK